MIIDIHTHIFPQAIRRDRQAHFAEEPAFRLLYERPRARLAGAAELIAAMDRSGVDRAVVFGFPWRSAERFRRHNDYVMQAVATHPERLIGLACFDVMHPEAPAETRRCLAGGLKGVGELAFYGAGITEANLAQMATVMAICRAHQVPVMIHTNEPVGHQYPGKAPNTLQQIYRLVGRFRENQIILAHWGAGLFFFGLLKKEVRETLRNVYFDTAASPFVYAPGIWPIACELAGADKILFGTDFPLLNPGRYFDEINTSPLTQEDRMRILGRNAAELFGLAEA
jgi:predicted TIM-barrel fold metal-dependent hydrolase